MLTAMYAFWAISTTGMTILICKSHKLVERLG